MPAAQKQQEIVQPFYQEVQHQHEEKEEKNDGDGLERQVDESPALRELRLLMEGKESKDKEISQSILDDHESDDFFEDDQSAYFKKLLGPRLWINLFKVCMCIDSV